MDNTFKHSQKIPQLYKACSRAIKDVIENGAGVKDVVFKKSTKFLSKQPLLALIAKTLQHYSAINKLISKVELLEKEPRFDPWLARILITQLLLTENGLNGTCKPITTILSYRTALENAAPDFLTYQKTQERVCKPRYVCVNTLAVTVDEAIDGFCGEGWSFVLYDGKSYEEFLAKVSALREYEFMIDFHIKELLVFPHKTMFYDHAAYICRTIRLQDKASLFPVQLLNAPPGSTVLDMCAAPGMKTIFLAERLNNVGLIYAVELDTNRFNTLNALIEGTGATCIRTINKDAFEVSAEDCPNVEYILLDPTCSGSGMIDRVGVDAEEKINRQRLHQLSSFQISLLKHALTHFPQVKRVVYSTCSIYSEENEYVVSEALRNNNSFKLISPRKLLDHSFSKPAYLVTDDSTKSVVRKCIHTSPEKDLTNGFFVAVFKRCGQGNDLVQDDVNNTVQTSEDVSTNSKTRNDDEQHLISDDNATEKNTKKKLQKVSVEEVSDFVVKEEKLDDVIKSAKKKKKKKKNRTNSVTQEKDLGEKKLEHTPENSHISKRNKSMEEILNKISRNASNIPQASEDVSTNSKTMNDNEHHLISDEVGTKKKTKKKLASVSVEEVKDCVVKEEKLDCIVMEENLDCVVKDEKLDSVAKEKPLHYLSKSAKKKKKKNDRTNTVAQKKDLGRKKLEHTPEKSHISKKNKSMEEILNKISRNASNIPQASEDVSTNSKTMNDNEQHLISDEAATKKKTKKKLANVSVEEVNNCVVKEEKRDDVSKSAKKKKKDKTNSVAQEKDLGGKKLEHMLANSHISKKDKSFEVILNKISENALHIPHTSEDVSTNSKAINDNKQHLINDEQASKKKTKRKLAKVSVEEVNDCVVEEKLDDESNSVKKKKNRTNIIDQEEDLDEKKLEDTNELKPETAYISQNKKFNEELLNKIRKNAQLFHNTETTVKRNLIDVDEEKQVKKRKHKKAQ